MLKISIIEGHTQRRLIVEGKLVGPWVAELRNACDNMNADLFGRKLVIDMRDVTAISQEGENVLFELIQTGVKVYCRGVFTKYVLKRVARRAKGTLERRRIDGAGSQSSSQKGAKSMRDSQGFYQNGPVGLG